MATVFGKEIVGVDASATAIQFANFHFSRPGLTFETSSIDSGRAGLGTFDVVVASHVLEHLTKPEEAIQDVAALAEWLVIEVPLEDCWAPRLASTLSTRRRTENPVGHVNFWTRDSFRAFLESAGLLAVRDFQYAAAPFSPYQTLAKRLVERTALGVLGLELYRRFLATHYAVLVRARSGVRYTRSAG